jgi:hypothetical protein
MEDGGAAVFDGHDGGGGGAANFSRVACQRGKGAAVGSRWPLAAGGWRLAASGSRLAAPLGHKRLPSSRERLEGKGLGWWLADGGSTWSQATPNFSREVRGGRAWVSAHGRLAAGGWELASLPLRRASSGAGGGLGAGVSTLLPSLRRASSAAGGGRLAGSWRLYTLANCEESEQRGWRLAGGWELAAGWWLGAGGWLVAGSWRLDGSWELASLHSCQL